jgi:hypothetical protein
LSGQSRRFDLRALSRLALFSACAAGLTYVLHEAFAWYAASLAVEHADTVHVVRPGSAFWYAPASVLGAVTAWDLLERDGDGVPVDADGAIELTVRPFELVTLRLLP